MRGTAWQVIFSHGMLLIAVQPYWRPGADLMLYSFHWETIVFQGISLGWGSRMLVISLFCNSEMPLEIACQHSINFRQMFLEWLIMVKWTCYETRVSTDMIHSWHIPKEKDVAISYLKLSTQSSMEWTFCTSLAMSKCQEAKITTVLLWIPHFLYLFFIHFCWPPIWSQHEAASAEHFTSILTWLDCER